MEVTGFFTAIIIGLIIGALGRLVVPGKQNIPILAHPAHRRCRRDPRHPRRQVLAERSGGYRV